MKNFFFFLFSIALSFGFATDIPQPIVSPQQPWLTGPLLAPSARTVPPGHINFEPYIYVSKTSHIYDKEWKIKHVPTFVVVESQSQFKWGFAENWDVQILPTFSWNHSHGQAKWVFNDLPIGLEYELLRHHHGKWYPMIKASLTETFPTGKYQHLHPSKNGTDAGGAGSYQSQLGITFGKLFHLGGQIWLSVRFNVDYTYLSPLHVKGINVYGGANDTDGTIYPGNQFTQILGMELTLARRWALALDIQNVYGNKTRFSGKRGTGTRGSPIAPGTSGQITPPTPVSPTTPTFFTLLPPLPPAVVGTPSFNQISIAPALEYNWNANLGIIGGAWFTVAGRNTADFFQWVIAFNLYH